MAKTKISEFSATPANNTDIDSINIAEGCAPSGINDAIRELMAQLKDFQTGAVGDSFNGPVGTTTAAAGAFTTLSASSTVSGTGFSTYLASPPAIGGTAAAAGSFTTLSASGAVTLSGGTANGVAYLNGSKVVTSGSALTFDGSKLGIGNQSTSGQLVVADALSTVLSASQDRRYRAAVLSGGVYYGGDIFGGLDSAGATVLGISTYDGSTSAVTSAIFKPSNSQFYINGSEQMRLTSTGLGIGTSSPATKLDVAATEATIRVTSTTGTNLTDVRVVNTGGTLYSGIERSAGGALGPTGAYEAFLLYGADRPMYIGTGNSYLRFGTNATERMRLDSSGNLGLGVTPSASNTCTNIELPYGATLSARSNTAAPQFAMMSNAVGNWYEATYKINGYATQYTQQGFDGTHKWYTAPSGTAGNAITFTQAMTLDASGNLGVGATSPAYKLDVFGTTPAIRLKANGVGNGVKLEQSSATGDVELNVIDGYALKFATSNTERARIDSSGNLLCGTTDSSATASVGLKLNPLGGVPQLAIVTDTSSSSNVQLSVYNLNATNNGYRFYVRADGGVYNYSANNFNLSDESEKTQISLAGNYLDKLCQIPVKTFLYKDQNDSSLNLGVIAQDVEKICPEFITKHNMGTEENPNIKLGVYETDLKYAMLKAIQELKAEFDAYKASHP